MADHMRWHNSNGKVLHKEITKVHREASFECIACGKKFKAKKVLKVIAHLFSGIRYLSIIFINN